MSIVKRKQQQQKNDVNDIHLTFVLWEEKKTIF